MSQEADGIELRIVVPRSALPATSAAPADLYSQHNCQALLGLTPRLFLELLRREDAPAVKRIGKTRLVERRAMLAFLDQVDAKATEADEELDGADRLLSELGCRPAGRQGAGDVR